MTILEFSLLVCAGSVIAGFLGALTGLGGGVVLVPMLAIRSQEAGRLRDVIQRLPPQYRIVLVLRDMEGLTDEEVAEITGLRSGTVRVRLHRARLFVRKELGKGLKPRSGKAAVASPASSQEQPGNEQPRPARCKAMFAELSNYLDEQLDDSLCEELSDTWAAANRARRSFPLSKRRLTSAEPPQRSALQVRRPSGSASNC